MTGPSPFGPPSRSEPAAPSRLLRFRIPILLLILALHLSLALRERGDLADDAYISARYARNLVQGHGLTYNRGPEKERVEGYSNFLWVMLLAAGQVAGKSPQLISRTAGLLANLVSIILVWLLVLRWSRSLPDPALTHFLDLAAALLLAVNLPFTIWAVSGLETPLFALEVILAFLCFGEGHGRRYAAALVAFLAALTRPEGILVVAALVLGRLAVLNRCRQRPFLSDGKNLLVFLAPYLVYFSWRYFYFGHNFFPNSAYAKVDLGWAGLREGLFYLWSFLKWGNLPLVALLGLGAYGLARRPGHLLAAPAIFIGFYLLFILAVGGDWMPDFRFFVHLMPLFIALAILGMADLESPRPDPAVPAWRRYLPAKLAVLAMLGLSLFRYGAYELKPSYDKDWHRHQGQFYLGMSRWVLRHVWRSETVAAGDIGYLGYFSDVDRIVDSNGLVDRHLAQRPGLASLTADLDYLFEQNPYCIVVMLHRYPGGEELGHSETDRALLADPRLPERFRFRTELFGWDNLELSRSDFKPRTSKVFFLLYTRRLEPGSYL
jgi:hypothetical protein